MDEPTETELLSERIDRLTELMIRRFREMEERLGGLDRDNGEIIGLLITLAAAADARAEPLIESLGGEAEDAPESPPTAPLLN